MPTVLNVGRGQYAVLRADSRIYSLAHTSAGWDVVNSIGTYVGTHPTYETAVEVASR